MFSVSGATQFRTDVDYIWEKLFKDKLGSVPIHFRRSVLSIFGSALVIKCLQKKKKRLYESCTLLRLDHDRISTLLSGLSGSLEFGKQALGRLGVQRVSPSSAQLILQRTVLYSRVFS